MNKYSPEYMTQIHKENMALASIKDAINKKEILEAQVKSCDANNTLTLVLGRNIIGKIPFEEIEYSLTGKETKTASATSKVGRHIKFIPVEVDETTKPITVICSRKAAQKECYDNYISKLIPGDIIDARIIKIVSYGAFCDIGCGIVSLLPTNNISVTHIVDPESILKYVHNIKAVIKSIDDEGRIQLTHKELLGTWEQEVSKIREGDIIPGVVLSKESYGVFVRLSQNLSGLAEVPEFDVNTGDKVTVKVTNIKPDNMKVKLIIISTSGSDNPDTEEHISFDYVISDGHIDKWVYSTETAKKQIITEF